MRIPVQSSVLSANDTVMSLYFLRWLVAEVTSTAPSPSATSRHHFPSTNPANLLNFRCSEHFTSIFATFLSNFKVQTVSFTLFSTNFANLLRICCLPLAFSQSWDIALIDGLAGSLCFVLCANGTPSFSSFSRSLSSSYPPI